MNRRPCRAHSSYPTGGARGFVAPARDGSRRQEGQASVMTLIFLAVILVATLSLYKAGRITTDKMELQNAADSVAYSVSVVEARDLNFAAYMNRAIVANEVSVGQVVGLASWAYHLASIRDYMTTYSRYIGDPLTVIGVGAGLNSIFGTIGTIFGTVGDVSTALFEPFAKGYSAIAHNANWAYGNAQYLYHASSMLSALGVVSEAIARNGPTGAQLSNYGLLSLISHAATFAEIPGLPGSTYTTRYDPTNVCPEDGSDAEACYHATGYERLASIVQNSRDNFTKGRGWELQFFEVLNDAGIIPDAFVFEENGFTYAGLNINQSFGIMSISAKFGVYFDISRNGGSELRHVSQDNGDTSGQNYNWSAADTGNLGAGVTLGLSLTFDLGLFDFSIGASGTVINNQLTIVVNVPIIGGVTVLNMAFPTELPFSSGFAQVGQDGATLESSSDHMGTESGGVPFGTNGPVEDEAYGDAANDLIAWFGAPVGIHPCCNSEAIGSDSVYRMADWDTRHVGLDSPIYRGGLPTYVDTTEDIALNYAGGPYLVVGLEMPEADFDAENWPANQEPNVKYIDGSDHPVNESLGGDVIGALAKSQVYFKRPNDLTYFARGDGYEEYGSTFNPYWQARLVETSHADRVAALALQQGQGTSPFAIAEFNEFADNLQDAYDAAKGIF